MAVSKRLRYEVLRRDNHACRYCGRAAPEVPLTVDHVVPAALGGGDRADNLVTACRECNAGKSASSPDAPIADDVKADALRWGAAMEYAAEQQLQDYYWRTEVHDWFEEVWGQWRHTGTGEFVPRPPDWEQSVLRLFIAGLPSEIIAEAVDTAMQASTVSPDRAFRYFCGICWRRIEDMQDVASARLAVAEEDDD